MIPLHVASEEMVALVAPAAALVALAVAVRVVVALAAAAPDFDDITNKAPLVASGALFVIWLFLFYEHRINYAFQLFKVKWLSQVTFGTSMVCQQLYIAISREINNRDAF